MDNMILNLPEYLEEEIKKMAERRNCTEERLYATLSDTGCLKDLEDAPHVS